MTARASICVLALLLFAACHQGPTGARTAEEAVQVTNLYRTENFPRAHPSRVVTEDLGDKWRVTYIRREGGTGGISSYEVDKASGRIVRDGGGQ